MIGRNMLVLLALFALVAAAAPAAADVPSWTVQYNASDLDGNGKIDYVEWVIPHLSNQTFEIILIAKAVHLDENRTIIEDVYDYASAQDNNWTTIPSGDYLRVKFERELTSNNDITIYARALNGSSEIAVYKQEDNNEIARFSGIGDENWYKIYLTNLSDGESLDSFDLKSFGDVEYDYVVDPVATEILRPNAAGDETGLSASSGTNWDDVNDVTPDEDSSVVGGPLDVVQHPYQCPGGYVRDLYSLSEASGSGNINNVTITVRAKYIYYQMLPTIYTKTVLGTGGTVYEGSAQQLTGSYADYETTYATNPKTGVAWTWSGISSLQAGVSLPRGCLYTDTLGSYGARSTQVYVTINYSTDISSCSYPISSPGTYNLTQNISSTGTCITINASNVTLDCQGFMINGTGAAGSYGINNTGGFDNVTIKNCVITNFNSGVYFSNGADNSAILNNTVRNNSNYGICLYPGSNSNLTGNTVSSNSQYGIVLISGANNTLRGNNVSSNFRGIYLFSGSNSNFANNTANSNSQWGIYLSSSSNNTLTGNTANLNSNYGLYLTSSSNNTLTNNNATNNTLLDFYSPDSSLNNTVINLTTQQNLVSFTSSDIALKGLTAAQAPAGDPSGYKNITKYINATNNSATSWLFLNFSYNDSDWQNANVSENTLQIWKYNGTWSQIPGSGIDNVSNVVYANITSFGSTFAPLGLVTNITSCPWAISSPGEYVLGSNISSAGTCITINASNVTLDCQGYTIGGDGVGVDTGVDNTAGFDNVTIRNCTVTNFWYGIYFGNSADYGIIANNTANSNVIGIFLLASSNNTIANNTASLSPHNNGIYIYQNSNNNTIMNNVISGHAQGISLVSSYNNVLTNNTANSNTNFGIYISSSNSNILVNNTASSNTNSGILLLSSSSNTLTNNNATGNFWDFHSSGNSLNNTVINLTTQQNVVSFTSTDIALKGLTTAQAPADTSGYKNISKYVNATNNSATSWLYINFSYAPEDVSFNESFLRVYKYNTSAAVWQLADGAGVNNVSVDDNVVYANITEFGSTFAPLGLYLGNLTCTVSVSCGTNETDILHLSSGTNAHAELPNESAYTNKVCCKDTTGFNSVLNSTGNNFLRLSNATNAHVQLSGDYPFLAYIGGSQNGVACNARYVNGVCSATNETCLLTMSNTTNAHVANCSAGAAYNLTVCCAFTTFPSCVLAAVENDTVIDGPDSLMWDAVNNSNTTANLTCDRTPVDCRWNETDIGYAAMSSVSNCTISSANISCSFGDLAEGTYARHVACADSYGNQQDASSNADVDFGVDLTGPTSTILYPLSGAWLNILFSMTVGDSDPLDLSEIETCYWSFTDQGTAATGNATRTANSPFTVTVGPSGNCTTQGINQCNITAWCTDWAGNVGS